MALLSEKDIAYITGRFAKELKDDVYFTLFIDKEDECDYCKKTAELLREVAALDSKLKLEVYNAQSDKEKAKSLGIDKFPGLLIQGKKKNTHLFYFGIPAGYQFAALLDDIVDLSNDRTRLAPTTIAALQKVEKPIEVTVFVSITDDLCPGAVRIAHQFAIESDKIWASMIDAEQFTELAIHNTVTRVPKIIVNGLLSVDEPLNEGEFLEHVLSTV
ncbi:MAG: protein disulfide oxidoreductase [Candidatus Micrarchaeales archaeon]